jgi:hypothetical protein
LIRGRLRDPRLDILCRTRSGAPVGLVWAQPSTSARYVAVEQPGYSEVYETAGGLPVRISTTSGVQTDDSLATFELSEHDANGDLVRRYRLTARVAG